MATKEELQQVVDEINAKLDEQTAVIASEASEQASHLQAFKDQLNTLEAQVLQLKQNPSQDATVDLSPLRAVLTRLEASNAAIKSIVPDDAVQAPATPVESAPVETPVTAEPVAPVAGEAPVAQ